MNYKSNFNTDYHFTSAVYRSNEPQFLSSVKSVFNEFVEKSKCDNKNATPVYPCVMTELISSDERINPFRQFVSQRAWDILYSQGYDMDLFHTDAYEMWGQHHLYMSNMEQHIHGLDVQLCGFYFLDTPPDSSRMFLYDPRTVKIYAGLPERMSESLTLAHNSVYYTPQPGDFIFTNSWLAHSFSRNASQDPYNFIHINIRASYKHNDICQVQSGPIVV